MTAGSAASTEIEHRGSGCPASDFARNFNPFDPEYLQDPYPVFARARHEEPVFYSPELNYWVVSRYADIIEVFRDTESFSAAAATEMYKPPCPAALEKLEEIGLVPAGMLVDEDPPMHTSHRRVLRKGVSPKRIREIEPATRKFVTSSIDRFVKNGAADLVTELAFDVPALTAFVLMGVPEAEVERVRKYASRFALWIWGRPSDAEQVELAKEYAAYLQYSRDHVERLIQSPGDDYMSIAIKAWLEDEGEEVWDQNYLATIMQAHLYASHETTTNAAANAFKVLLENPVQWAMICEDRSLVPKAVEEVLRYHSSVPAWRRKTTKPVVVGDIEIGAGENILLLTGSANHDSDKFADSETFDITRDNARQHLAFGWGPHLCLGQELARMELRVILEEATARLPHLELVADQEWTYSPNTSFRGPDHVLVTWDPSKNPNPWDRG